MSGNKKVQSISSEAITEIRKCHVPWGTYTLSSLSTGSMIFMHGSLVQLYARGLNMKSSNVYHTAFHDCYACAYHLRSELAEFQ